jgi:predicted transglutaminase-like protease
MTLLESILAITISLVTIITSTALGVRWLTKHYFDEIKHEMKPNSGLSMKDQVTRIEKELEDLKNQNIKGEEYHEKLDVKIENLTKLFIEYITRSGK